jgi:hypothetical protein
MSWIVTRTAQVTEFEERAVLVENAGRIPPPVIPKITVPISRQVSRKRSLIQVLVKLKFAAP